VRGLGCGEVGEPGFPAGFQAAGDQPVLRLAGEEGTFGPAGVVAGALDRQPGGARRSLAASGDFPGGG